MDINSNKQRVVNAIWDNPELAFRCMFNRGTTYLSNVANTEYNESGKIRLSLTRGKTNIQVWYNGSQRESGLDVFTYMEEYVLHTGGFKDTLTELARLYGIELQLTKEQQQKLTREALAREITPSLIEALRANPDGPAAKYLSDVRKMNPGGKYFGELTTDSIKQVKQTLKNKNYKYNINDLEALGIKEDYAKHGYNLVIPYYNNGHVVGFVLRNTNIDIDKPDRYRYSSALGRTGYCDSLKIGQPAVFVEGQFDAIRLIQAGVPNVIGIGGDKISDDIAKLLYYRHIKQAVYIPDVEYNEQGERKTELIGKAIKSIQDAKVNDERVFNTLYIADIPTPEGVELKDYKMDADSYGRDNGNDALLTLVSTDSLQPWYLWEIYNILFPWGKSQQDVNICEFQQRFSDIYNRCATVWERQTIKDYIKGNETFTTFHITPAACDEQDEWNRNAKYNAEIKQYSAELAKAVQEQATPETVAGIISRLSAAQANNARDDWNEQLNATFEDELKAIQEQPDTVHTKWNLGNINYQAQKDQNKFVKYEQIEFYPADITVFCAPTSHGKTMILFQSAMDMVNTYTDKTVIYISCEENKRQLIERALNVFIDIPTTEDGTDGSFITGTRKKSIKAIIKGVGTPYEYEPIFGRSERFERLRTKVKAQINNYSEQIRPRLKFIHTDSTTENICTNLLRTVEEYRNNGVDVGAVFVDYMQLLSTDARNYSRHDELKDICKALRDCAAKLEIPVIIAAQLNRQVLNASQGGGLDNITVANIGEGADIERIAHDIYLVWQIDKTNEQQYTTAKYPIGLNGKEDKTREPIPTIDASKMGIRSNRIYTQSGKMLSNKYRQLKTGYLYVEQMKARDGKTGGWGLFPFNGERGMIGENDTTKMAE